MEFRRVLFRSEILDENRLDEEQRGHVETIRQSGESLLAIINGILDFSKIEAGRMMLESAPFDLKSTASKVLKLVWPQARGRGLRSEGRREGKEGGRTGRAGGSREQ